MWVSDFCVFLYFGFVICSVLFASVSKMKVWQIGFLQFRINGEQMCPPWFSVFAFDSILWGVSA